MFYSKSQEEYRECEACQEYPAGMILYPLTPNGELMGVQRCDSCEVYKTDLHAGDAYRKLLGLDSANLNVAVGISHAIESAYPFN